ncbi:GNAT family N-acetyltransferase [Paucibacter sp. APW11]|uniref:GNAT family N-acetyltransferase n=1 Tax=Roseateles aquae TaxID=3077235 RepID=A0ABU3P7P0_9BURK|nr:GNAT family N-acetyltransferase [Paucibacter sp. APW11]MDT8998592.1 GNAT family N-acetyltransferase [Paucibacter sp. APW11]
MRWECQRFCALSGAALYELLSLRAEVFVVEQRCIYQDLDGLDPDLWHLRGLDEASGQLLAYARLLPPGAKGAAQSEPMIGRVLTAPQARGSGQGRALMQQALLHCERLWPGQAVALSAQAHLQDFYASLGFVPCSAVYDEDGIAHIDMRRESQV